jgi:1,6-anhydro-N-acetylmuramate kinase
MAFAVFADLAVQGQAAGLPNITGVKHAVVLGKIAL